MGQAHLDSRTKRCNQDSSLYILRLGCRWHTGLKPRVRATVSVPLRIPGFSLQSSMYIGIGAYPVIRTVRLTPFFVLASATHSTAEFTTSSLTRNQVCKTHNPTLFPLLQPQPVTRNTNFPNQLNRDTECGVKRRIWHFGGIEKLCAASLWHHLGRHTGFTKISPVAGVFEDHQHQSIHWLSFP